MRRNGRKFPRSSKEGLRKLVISLSKGKNDRKSGSSDAQGEGLTRRSGWGG